jgi:L-asparaginase II
MGYLGAAALPVAVTIVKLIGGIPLVAVMRGDLVESVHDVAGCAVDASGAAVLEFGTVDVPIYLRSSAKPFIAATALLAGVAERFGLEQREIAVMAASHEGEPFHIEAVRSILGKIGLPESALQCGPESPSAGEAITNNCSGKHAGILALCLAIGADPATYMEPSNPAQERILRLCAQLSDERYEDLSIGVDGCGIPVYATTLRRAALSYRRLANLEGLPADVAAALRTVRAAMIAYPEYMSGTGVFDASAIRAFGGALVCKGGAEGVFAAALLDEGIGLVIKVIDGNERARPAAAIEALGALGVMTPQRREQLARFERRPIKNKRGRLVGEIHALPGALP